MFLGIPEMKDFPNIFKIIDFLLANLGIPDKSMISRDLRLPGILEIKDFPNILEILASLLANLGNLDKSIISKGFPRAKPFGQNKKPRET